jgi:hypothetical protein
MFINVAHQHIFVSIDFDVLFREIRYAESPKQLKRRGERVRRTCPTLAVTEQIANLLRQSSYQGIV